MHIKNPEIVIDKQEPFKSDALGRRESALVLTELVASLDGPFVLSIDSTWGTGKTTFVRMWEQHLRNEGFHCLYFNAWENDFCDDPLVPFIGEIQSRIVAKLGEERAKARETFDKAKRIAGVLLKRAIPAGLKIATAGVLDLDQVTEKALADLAAKVAQDTIESYEKDKETLKAFRQSLGEFAAELTKDDSRKPLVLLIDELDRCRPTYAVELLERVKHLFSVPGMVFVLVLDKEQIGHSIKALYGADMDVDGYLRRFIDLDYHLPEASHESFCEHLFQQFEFADFFAARQPTGLNDQDELLTVFTETARLFGFSLRVQEQCFTQFSIVLRTTSRSAPLRPVFLAFLIALKAANADLYRRFVQDASVSEQVLDFVRGQPGGVDFMTGDIGTFIEAHVASAHCRRYEMDGFVDEYQRKWKQQVMGGDTTHEQRRREERIVKIFEKFARWGHGREIDYLASKIDISERFSTGSTR